MVSPTTTWRWAPPREGEPAGTFDHQKSLPVCLLTHKMKATYTHKTQKLSHWASHIPSFTFTYPIITGVVGAPQMTSQPVSSIFFWSPLPNGTLWTLGLSIPWCCLPISFLYALSSSPFLFVLQDGFCQTWWTENMSIPFQFVSLYDGQEVFFWSNFLLDLGTDVLADMVFVWGLYICW